MYTVGIIIIIILFSSILVIRNSFSISVTERTKQYGMLASIGATRKTNKENVLYEGAILSIIAIPIGIIRLELGQYGYCLKIVNSILVDYLNGLEFNVTLWIPGLIIAAVISLITMFLSVITPAKKTAKNFSY